MNFFDERHHLELRNQILKLRKDWLISYDDADLIRELYPTMEKYIYSLSQCTSNRIGDELIILGDSIHCDEALKYLKNIKYLT